MFTIRLYKIGHKVPQVVSPTTVETLAEAEIIALDRAEREFNIAPLELVYIEDLDYYVYNEDTRIARLTINPVYAKRSVQK